MKNYGINFNPTLFMPNFINKVINMRNDFIKTHNENPTKIYMDAITYKFLELSNKHNATQLSQLQYNIENKTQTFLGMVIEAVPTTDKLLLLGYRDSEDNVGLTLYLKQIQDQIEGEYCGQFR